MANRRFWPAALVLVLIAALGVLVSSPAEAKKKPKSPLARWAITIPACDLEVAGNCLPGVDNAFPCSLCGIGKTYYKDSADEDGLGIRVSSGQEQGSINSRFSFAIYRCKPDERCYEDYQGQEEPIEPPPPVYLQDIALDLENVDYAESPCQFPGMDSEGATCRDLYDPDDPTAACMECFLNGPHPYWVTGSPEEDYRSFIFELTVFEYDYESSPHPFDGSAYLSIEAYNTDDILLPPGDGDDHNIFGDNWQVPTEVYIARGGQDSWTVNVTVTGPMRFREWYRGCARPPNSKDKCPTEYKFPLDASSSNLPHAFQVTWTRLPPAED